MNIKEIIKKALEEDLGNGDHTSLATIPSTAKGKAQLLIKEEGIMAGTDIGKQVFTTVDPATRVHIRLHDGQPVKPGDIVMEVEGRAISILSAERLALNFMQRMSGIATYTHKLTSLIRGYNCTLLDTRKTTPLLRELEKYAVKAGGGENHRMGLFDMIMIKDNHVDFAGGLKNAIEATRKYLAAKKMDLKIEVEVRNFDELEEVLGLGGIDRIMLDNFSPEDMAKAVKKINGRYETEASGGITEKNIVGYAATGVDYISIGALTHRIKSLDMSLLATF
jgi:nicotinate-nucleotide pyrophosphorylase (carboxylating)